VKFDPDATLSKVSWRLIPLLFLCYIIAYIDRINVGFAGLQLQKAFGVDSSRPELIQPLEERVGGRALIDDSLRSRLSGRCSHIFRIFNQT
jgi:hypothetical protein